MNTLQTAALGDRPAQYDGFLLSQLVQAPPGEGASDWTGSVPSLTQAHTPQVHTLLPSHQCMPIFVNTRTGDTQAMCQALFK